MNSAELARRTNKTRKYFDYILCGKRRPSPGLAKELETITGIDRRAWLWPDEFPNPLLMEAIDEAQQTARPQEGELAVGTA